MQRAEQVVALIGHDDGHGEYRVFKCSCQREILRAAEEYALRPTEWTEMLKRNPHWLVPMPLVEIVKQWIEAAEAVNSDATLTIFLDCCRAGAALQQLLDLSIGNRRIGVFAPCAAGESTDGGVLTRLLFNADTEWLQALCAVQRPCCASTRNYNSRCFDVARYSI